MTTSLDAFPLIPRDHLFGNPTRAAGQISPDGRWLSWLAPRDGVLNIWMAPSDDPEAARAMSASTDRPIREYMWAPDSCSLLYIQDKGGDENFLLYGINVESGTETTLTPFEDTRVMLIGGSEKYRDRILIGLNNRDARFHDAYLLDLNSGELTLVLENNAYAGFMADDDLQLRLAVLPNAEGGTDYFRIVDNVVEGAPFKSTGIDDALTTAPAGFTRDGKTIYWLESEGRDTAALLAMDWKSGVTRLIAEDERADIGGTLRDRKTGEVLAYSVTYLKREWKAFDEDIAAAFAFLRKQLEGEFGISSRTDDDRKWIVSNDPVVKPAASYLFDRDAGTLTKLYTTRPELEGAPLQPMQTLELTSRDGLTLPSYLTLPPGADSDGNGVPDAPVPMVLFVHGGPWARDGYGYNGHHQWLANRGYAVLSVNFRGSTGFGKHFVNAANLEWGRKMQDDLLDAVDWAVETGIAPRDKIAIMGGSYGGYATLAGLAFTPEVFACGVDIVGPSNLETLLGSIPPYWEPMVAQFHTRMGNPNTEDGLAMIKERSPLYKAGDIIRPLLIAQGANDPRVKQAESDQIVDAMKEAGIPVTYLLYPDEGHGFAKPANNIAFSAVAENFLATNLGGRAEPVGETLAKSTAEIPTGSQFVAGLAEALESA
ncbi:MAG: S9 family peptidase [Erythrobacter sp.]|nr:S9 family peptidase [Erythrobacter sp.]